MILPAHAIAAYCKMKGYPLATTPGHLNIIYIEGLNEDFTPNAGDQEEWSDLRILIGHRYDTLVPFIRFMQVATTEPGRKPIFSEEKGGFARMAFRHYASKWIQGYQNVAKFGRKHPALIQKRGESVMVHREFNAVGERVGEPISPAFSINHCGIMPGAKLQFFGKNALASPIGLDWEQHLEFIGLTRTDTRFLENQNFAYSASIISGDDFLAFRTDVA